MANRLRYEIVIATRNRTGPLVACLESILAQSRTPERLTVVDASDDARPVSEILDEVRSRTTIPIDFFRSEAGSALQRNVGLRRATSDVVFFPDDDSIMAPDTLELMMQTYERDTEQRIGGVCGEEVFDLGAVTSGTVARPLEGAANGASKKAYLRLRHIFETTVCPDPFLVYARQRIAAQKKPDWIDGHAFHEIPWMQGFKMSFRRSLIQAGFDETLRRYALFEDTELCCRVLQSHLLVQTSAAKIFHNKAPGQRGDGRMMGAMQVLNRALIVRRYGRQDSKLKKHFYRFSLYKIIAYLAACRSPFGRQRFKGACKALRLSRKVFRAPDDGLVAVYQGALAKAAT